MSCRLSDHVPLTKPVSFGAADTLKVIIMATEDGAPKRPHQAFLLLRDQDTGLEATFPFSVKGSGKGKVDFVCVHQEDAIRGCLANTATRHRKIFHTSS